jgi:hypothetical protein
MRRDRSRITSQQSLRDSLIQRFIAARIEQPSEVWRHPTFKLGFNRMSKTRNKDAPDDLKGWDEIAAFLEQPVSVTKRWAQFGYAEKNGAIRLLVA